MDAAQDAAVGDNRQRKFGLPNWMVNNIERLNFVTDFEQYACSPPEVEGFLSEHSDPYESHSDCIDSFCPVVEPSEYAESKPKLLLESTMHEINQPIDFSSSSSDHSPGHYHSILNSLKHEEFISSPDSTPCATPEPSPAPRRKMSGQQDTVRTNPGRWFYLGNYQDQHLKAQSNIQRNKGKRDKNAEKSSDISAKASGSPFQSKKDGLKLVISNFDINAISPTSW